MTKKRDPLDQAFHRLEQAVPERVRPALHWLHGPRSRPVRIPLAVLFIIGGFFSYLPVLGVELFPIGLLLIAHDVPMLRRPASRLTMWMLDAYDGLRRLWHRHRPRRGRQGRHKGQ